MLAGKERAKSDTQTSLSDRAAQKHCGHYYALCTCPTAGTWKHLASDIFTWQWQGRLSPSLGLEVLSQEIK